VECHTLAILYYNLSLFFDVCRCGCCRSEAKSLAPDLKPLYFKFISRLKKLLLKIQKLPREEALENCSLFQRTLLVEISTLVTWLKSTLLLKIECRETHIYMKAECLQTKWDTALFRGERKKPQGQRWKVRPCITNFFLLRPYQND